MQVIDYLVKALRGSATFNPAVQIAPAAVIWTDETCQWQGAMPYIKECLPELLEFGDYKPEQRTGPAIWLKCVLGGVLEDVALPADRTPIIYLPGVGRKSLRAIESCSDALRPLAELQYRGSWFAYPSGRDWTLSAFLTYPGIGLELDVAKDKKTQEVLPQVLRDLLESPVDKLKGKRLEAKDFQELVFNDPTKDLLAWMNDPQSKREQWDDNKWQVFCGACVGLLGNIPSEEAMPELLQALASAKGPWHDAWHRFEDTAHNLPSLVKALHSVEPMDLAADYSHYPSENAREEQRIETALESYQEEPATELRNKLINWYEEHKAREGWLWNRLGESKWLPVLAQLADVARLTEKVFTHNSPVEMAALYQEKFWQADAAALQAMALAKEPLQQELVAKLLAIVYTPWLEAVTLNFQRLVQTQGYPGYREVKEDSPAYHPKGLVLFFVDGLRLDCGMALQQKLLARSINVSLKTQWSALPSLTATAKAAVTPVAGLLSGKQGTEDFIPAVSESGSAFGSHHFKKLLAQQGWQYLEGLDVGDPQGLAWLQTGDLDNLGHHQQRKLPQGIDAVLDEVVDRICHLLEAGWQRVRIVTDHGWLWLPDKLPKVELDKPLVRKHLSRCAILHDNVSTGLPQVGWHWNPNVTIAMAPGIGVFTFGDFYQHGGLSLQECLTPVLEITQ